jgi:hypothetical protein
MATPTGGAPMEKKSMNSPDETRTFEKGKLKRLFAMSKILQASCYLRSLLPVPHRWYCYYYCYSQYYITKYNVKGLLDG